MGFEEAVPPVPQRIDEINMLNRLQQSWLKQPFYRYYMQQDVRQTKMEYAKYNFATRRNYLLNCLLISFFTLPLAYFTRRFYTYNSLGSKGVPFVKELPYFQRYRSSVFDRTKAANKTFVWVWFLSTALGSVLVSRWAYRQDENYDTFSKVKKML